MKRRALLGVLLLLALGVGATYWYMQQGVHTSDLLQETSSLKESEVGSIGSSSPTNLTLGEEEVVYNERYPNTRRKILPLHESRSWTHPSGVTVRLYEKDHFILEDEYGTEVAVQKILKAQTIDGRELVLLNQEPWNVHLAANIVGSVEFSPLGTYASVAGSGYEAPFRATYNLKTGAQEFMEPEYRFSQPYWTPDEGKLALLRDSVPIDGTVAAIFYSTTGDPEHLALVKEFVADTALGRSTDPSLNYVTFKNGTLTLQLAVSRVNWGDERDIIEVYSFNLATGTLTN